MKTILHIINKSSLRCHSVSQLQMLTSAQDGILFFENGVYNAISTQTNQAIFAMIGGKVFAMLPDLKARGYEQLDIMADITAVDYDEFVELTLKYDLVRSW